MAQTHFNNGWDYAATGGRIVLPDNGFSKDFLTGFNWYILMHPEKYPDWIYEDAKAYWGIG